MCVTVSIYQLWWWPLTCSKHWMPPAIVLHVWTYRSVLVRQLCLVELQDVGDSLKVQHVIITLVLMHLYKILASLDIISYYDVKHLDFQVIYNGVSLDCGTIFLSWTIFIMIPLKDDVLNNGNTSKSSLNTSSGCRRITITLLDQMILCHPKLSDDNCYKTTVI